MEEIKEFRCRGPKASLRNEKVVKVSQRMREERDNGRFELPAEKQRSKYDTEADVVKDTLFSTVYTS